jgi:hypothetical protein
MSHLTIAVGVTTCPRPDPYIYRSLNSFRGAGFSEKLHIFCEPESPDLSDVENHVRLDSEPKLGAFPNWKRGLHYLLDNTDDPWIMMLQDDVTWTADAARTMYESINRVTHANDIGFLSPYASAGMVGSPYKVKRERSHGRLPPSRPRPGLIPQWIDAKHGKGRGFWGALAICMPRRSAELLRETPRFRDHTHHRKIDVVLGNAFIVLGLARKIYVPSLCHHIGEISTLGRHRIKGIAWGRKGFGFVPQPGEEFAF